MASFQHHEDSRIRRPHTRRAPAPRRHQSRPRLESLESRNLLTNYTAATVSDLIAEIKAANQVGGSNAITLVAPTTSPYVLTAVDNTTDGPTGLPVIAANDNLTIVGNGDAIARSSAAGTPAFRLLDVAAAASLTLKSVTLQGGLAPSSNGGAIYSQGTVELNDVTVQNNVAQDWWSGGSLGFGYLVGGAGGGIYSDGALTLEGGTTVRNNQAVGGPVEFRAGADGLGGGLYIAGGTVALINANVSSNTTQGGQGGIYLQPHPHGHPVPPIPPGPGGNGLGGGLYVAGGTVTLTSDTLSSNSARGGQGGGWYGGTGAAGGDGFGGALYVAGGTVTLRNDTVTSNTAQGGPGGSGSVIGSPGPGQGGGLYIGTLVTVYLDAFSQAHVIKNTPSTSDPNIHGLWNSI